MARMTHRTHSGVRYGECTEPSGKRGRGGSKMRQLRQLMALFAQRGEVAHTNTHTTHVLGPHNKQDK
jgi:hypothetical protein